MKLPINEKGFAPVILLIGAVILIAVLSGGAFYLSRQTVNTDSAEDTTLKLPTSSPMTKQPQATSSTSCSDQCQALIDVKVNQLKQDLLKSLQSSGGTTTTTILPIASPASTQAYSTPTSNTPKEIFVYFGVSGSSNSTDWSDLSGAQISFDTANYPGAKGFYFQASIQSDAPDRTAYARVANASNGTGISGSDISFTGLTSTFKESAAMSLPSGTLTLKVQLDSLNGNLVTVQNPRIRIAY